MKNYIKRMSGWTQSPPRKPMVKILWSTLGAFLGIYLVSILSRYSPFQLFDHLFLVGSFGASAVLIYGAPQAEFSQPRNLVGGHIVSAAVGVTVFQLLSFDVPMQAALAVSLAVAAMHLTRTLHPPGGATALIAVIGSEQVHELGYQFLLSPIAAGALLLLLVALLVNNLSANQKRHYPAFWF